MRVIAALLVLLFHASYDRFGGNWLRPAFADSGQPAVIMFFVLSGFVIAWTADVKERTFNVYIVNRMARLWSVAVPALALTLFADKIGLAIDPKIYPGWLLPLEAHPFRQLAISATFLNQVWFFDVQPLSNGPFWSLSYEWWYYVAFGCIALTQGRWGWLFGLAAIAIMGPKIWLLFPTWLMGVAVYRSIEAARRLPLAVGLILFLTPLGLIGIYQFERTAHLGEQMLKIVDHRFIGHPNVVTGTVFGALMAMHLYSLPSLNGYLMRVLMPVEGLVRWIAGATLSIYLFHFPLLQLFGAIADVRSSSPFWVNAGIVLCTLSCCFALSFVTERRKRMVRSWIETVFGCLSLAHRRLWASATTR